MTGEAADTRSDAPEHRDPAVLRRARWTRALRLLPSALLIGVACHQILLARSDGLAPWSGGGFGMFASTDAGATRHLHAFLLRPGLRREVEPPQSAADRVRRTLTLPSESNLRSLAAALADVPTPDHGPVSAVEIQIWHTRFDPETLAPAGRILRGIEAPLACE